MTDVQDINTAIEPARKMVINHPIYKSINTPDSLVRFMEYHVYAVWDFMSLLKGLQRELTCTTLPWVPVGDAQTRYLINEIVTGEESDVDEQGVRMSHYELYLKAMKECGADVTPITHFVDLFSNGASLEESLETASVPSAAADFLRFTFSIVESGKPHLMAAVFTYGREDLIPDMFVELVRDIDTNHGGQFSILKYYLERHIEVDGDHHSHLALEMTARLCGDDESKWEEARIASETALNLRANLWTAVLDANQ